MGTGGQQGRLALVLGLAVLFAAPALAGELDAAIGKALFERQWVPAPTATDANDGLGPLFSAKSCAACHAGGGGARLVATAKGDVMRGVVVRLVGPGGAPHALLGRQLQDQAIPGLAAEGQISWTATGADVHFTDDPGMVLTEPRLAPSLKMMMTIGQIAESAILEAEDPDDRNGDGISGRARRLTRGPEAGLTGRYGLKASHATLASQISDAFAFDLGMSSARFPLPHGDCTARQKPCLSAPDGESQAMGGHEISDEVIRLLASYLLSLKPERQSTTLPGRQLAETAGCTACHRPVLPSAQGGNVPLWSDLLLHDMGPGDTGVVAEDDVLPSEWRTPPLADLVSPERKRRYMHDGSAGTLAEAIGHHGGEGLAAKMAFEGMTDDEKSALLEFLETL
jgi:CxxC motif-containing protein (DUF1111 family)